MEIRGESVETGKSAFWFIVVVLSGLTVEEIARKSEKPALAAAPVAKPVNCVYAPWEKQPAGCDGVGPQPWCNPQQASHQAYACDKPVRPGTPVDLGNGWQVTENCVKPGYAGVDPHQPVVYPEYIMKMSDLVANYQIPITAVPESSRVPVLGDLRSRYPGFVSSCFH